ncbi:MAG TPA: DUF2156 domain-containing protein [Nitrospirae bacterium]|nr:DUF2156 domain-containing protein [Nitrospirota bacterium]
MKKEPLQLHHKNLLSERLKSLSLSISEYSFPNLYLFREIHKYEVLIGKEIFIRGITYDKHRYLMPAFDITKCDKNHLIEMMLNVDFLFPIDESWLGYFDEEIFDFTAKKCDMDYVYTTEKMKTFSGRKLHKKRNLMKQFLETYKHSEYPLIESRKLDAFDILDTWQRDMSLEGELTDYEPCKEALMLSEELSICGVIYYADDEPAGFILGEELNPETFVMHFVKAKKKFKGIYQYMYNSFANLLPVKYKYLNYEQDLGREALRITKNSYIPDLMIKKYRIALKK